MQEGKTYKLTLPGAIKWPSWMRTEEEMMEYIKKHYRKMNMEKKKMTKTEAFEYLKNRKIYVNGKTAAIQRKLFKAGFAWGMDKTTKYEDKLFLFTYENALLSLTHSSDMNYFRGHKNTEISAEEILAIEIQEEKPNYEKELAKMAQPIREYMRKHNISGRLVVSQYSIAVEDLRFIYPNNPED